MDVCSVFLERSSVCWMMHHQVVCRNVIVVWMVVVSLREVLVLPNEGSGTLATCHQFLWIVVGAQGCPPVIVSQV